VSVLGEDFVSMDWKMFVKSNLFYHFMLNYLANTRKGYWGCFYIL